jgi:hypothetical protein
MEQIIVIGITGKKGSGKDLFGKYLMDQFSGTHYCFRMGFADFLKEEIAELTGGSVVEINKNKNDQRLRWILQQYGTEYGRAMQDPEHWVSKLQDKIFETRSFYPNKKLFIVIPDVRFKNERNFIKQTFPQSLIYCVERSKVEQISLPFIDNHSSETELDHIQTDFFIHNDHTEVFLENIVKNEANNIRERFC